MAYDIRSTSGKGNFTISKDGQEHFLVNYKGWFSSKADTELNGKPLQIRPQNVWNSKFDILHNDVDQGDIIFNWKGNIIIRIANSVTDMEDEFMLRSKGFWKQHFELIDQSERIYLTMHPKFNWKTFTYSYSINEEDHDLPEERVAELLVYCGFGANLYMAMMAGAVAAS